MQRIRGAGRTAERADQRRVLAALHADEPVHGNET
jgi:hypothetical protein